MRRTWITIAATSLAAAFAVVSAPRLFAGDPPGGLSAEEQAKVTRLIEDLGSSDFRIREAATKALIEMGAKARPALEAAMKSENPAVRFRADQILQGLSGGPKEKAVDDGQDGQPGQPGATKPGGGAAGPRLDSLDNLERWMKEWMAGQGQRGANGQFEEQIRELQKRLEEMQKQWGGGLSNPNPLGPWTSPNWPELNLRRFRMPAFGAQLRNRDVHAKVDASGVVAEAIEGPRGARITVTNKNDPSDVTTFSGKSIGAILEAHPTLRAWPGVPDLLAKFEEARAKRDAEVKAAEEAAKKQAESGTPGWSSSLNAKSVKIESTQGRVRVEISETGPDGKPVTKTYEGTDLESLKAQHPELKDSLGGMDIHIGGGGQGFGSGGTIIGPDGKPLVGPDGKPLGGGVRVFRFGDEKDEDGDDEGMEDASERKTGPFGLGLMPVDPTTASQTPLAAGKSVVVVIREGSEAAKIGLQVRDIITKVNGAEIASLEDLGKTLRGVGKDAPLSIEVLRDGKTVTLKR